MCLSFLMLHVLKTFSFEIMKASLYGAGSFECKIRRKRKFGGKKVRIFKFSSQARYICVRLSDLRCDSCYFVRRRHLTDGRSSVNKPLRGRVDIRPAQYEIHTEFGLKFH